MAMPPGTNNMHNLTTLIKRLEAATSRLEDIASSTVELPKVDGVPVISTTSPLSPPAAQASQINECVPGDLPESVEEFDAFISGPVQNFVNISNKLGGPVAEQACSLLKAFSGQRKFIFITTKAKKPDMSSATFMQLLKPLQDSITAISEIRDSNRGSLAFNQLSAVSESIGVLAWITVEPKPHKHIMEYLGSAQYWGNRVLKDYKDSDPKQVEWIQSYYKVFNDLAEYVKQTFPSGILWNSSGISAEEAIKVVEKSTPPSFSNHSKAPGAPPPPPPPPPGPPPSILLDDSKQTNSKNGIGAVFSEINKGADITKGLKISSDQMTHKNPSLRAGATVLARSDSNTSASSISPSKSPIPGKKPKPESMRTKKPSVKKLEGNKWFIENFENEPQPVKIEASISQSIIISRCSKTTIIIHGKANAISIDNSPKLSLIVDSLVSSVDIIKSSSFAMQVLGTLPTILMDSVDGAQVYLGKDSLGTEIFSSKSTGINLNILDASKDDDDYKEIPLPEQIRTWIDGGKVLNEIVEHAG
ncbi:cyclase-associated protein [Blumeria graminis f. sp. tritici 96224]|uniref:Adenylyl cyclase-associated protein n=1 Tax=Blumeria graminis f. sp. tritici 96224 TaxID=1268274 RepID=A0A656KNH6_BLUGR|nr:cyclase-associated protein [Blumeria graminis f. sp. tritici 96224]